MAGVLAQSGFPIGLVGCARRGIGAARRCSTLSDTKMPLKEIIMKSAVQTTPPRMSFFGCGTSHFQSEPILYDSQGSKIQPTSDWEFELDKNLKGLKSGITHKQVEAQLPHFLAKSQKYIDRSAELGNNMVRFSIDFARLCPAKGEFNAPLMAEYVRVLARIRISRQEPMLTMHHFTMPRYLVETDQKGAITKGGWEHPEVLKHFRFYMESVVKFLGDKDAIRAILIEENCNATIQEQLLDEGLVYYFLSINEPAITSLNSYISGVFPPYKRISLLTARKVLGTIRDAHDICRSEVKTLGSMMPMSRQPQIGVGYNWQYYDGAFGAITHKCLDRYYTDLFERDGSFSDFIGLHYYFRQTMPFFTKRWGGRIYSDMPTFGDVYPKGILKVLQQMHSAYPSKPIFISEVGFSDASDLRRPFWILETLRYIALAHSQGIPIAGVLLWSLVNNFEWDLGMEQKFGLFDEIELSSPLSRNAERIRSWETWKLGVNAHRHPTHESLEELQIGYERSKLQHEASLGMD
jgi:beta-glucosidase